MKLRATDAVGAILAGRAAAGMTVEGTLDLSGLTRPFRLPLDLRIEGDLLLTHSGVQELPDGLRARTIHADRCPGLVRIGRIAKADYLTAKHCVALVEIAGPLEVLDIDLSGCVAVERLPKVVRCDRLDLTGCCSLSVLAERFYARHLTLSGCRRLRTAPAPGQADNLIVDEDTGFPYDWRRMTVADASARHWIHARRARSGMRTSRLSLAGHTWVRDLPAALHVAGDLDLEGCANIAALPASLQVDGKLTLTGCTKLGPLPDGVKAHSLVMPDGRPGEPRRERMGFFRAVKNVGAIIGVLARVRPSIPQEVLAQAVSADEARKAILDGRPSVAVRESLTLTRLAELSALPAQLWVFGDLTLSTLGGLQQMPADLRVTGALQIGDCPALARLPALAARAITIARCPALVEHGPMTAESVSIERCDGLATIGAAIVTDHLSVRSCAGVRQVADGLTCSTLVLEGLDKLERVPASSHVTTLYLQSLPAVAEVAIPVQIKSLSVRRVPGFHALPDGLELRKLEIADCERFSALPAGLKVTGDLALRSCPIRTVPADTRAVGFSAAELPELETIDAAWRDLSAFRVERCPRLVTLPQTLESVRDEFRVERCPALTALPPRLHVRKSMSVAGCTSLRQLPAGMPPPEQIELGGSALEGIPAGWKGVALTWDRLPFTERRLFQTQTLTPDEVLGEPNVEARRILAERYGLMRLVGAKGVELVHEDADPGGTRRLLRIPMGAGEPFLVLEVHCPSTRRAFHLRVPPYLTSCRDAAAWTAGFHRADEYNPIVET